jgi:hypothetical protein
MTSILTSTVLNIHPFKDNGKWVWAVSDDFYVQFGNADGPVFIIPMGFSTDLGTIPWWVRSLFNSSDPAAAPAYVAHDWINSLTQGQPPGPDVWSSQAAAAMLYDMLRIQGVPLWSAKAQYLGVVAGIAKKEW